MSPEQLEQTEAEQLEQTEFTRSSIGPRVLPLVI